MPNPPPAKLAPHDPVSALRGVGPERAAQLAKLEIFTLRDLLLHRPRRHEDRRRVRTIAELELGEATTVCGKIVAAGVKTYRQRTKSVFEFVLEDGSGRLHCRWWNQAWLQDKFKVGDELLVFGKVRDTRPRTMEQPETEIIDAGEDRSIHLNRIAPVYPLTEGLQQRWLRGTVWRALQALPDLGDAPWQTGNPAGGLAGAEPANPTADGETASPPLSPSTDGAKDAPAPAAPATDLDLPAPGEALRMLHFPEELPDAERARKYFALGEFVEMQLAIQRRRRNLESKAKALPCGGDNRLIKPFLGSLGFKLTAAQTKTLRELRADMQGAVPMRRLLQGDVGSGKTVVAACCALMALESGHNVAFMAPTEILAEQHRLTLGRWLAPLNIAVELRTSSHKQAGDLATPLLDRAGSGENRPRIVVGTHALISGGFSLEKLGLVIIDEQHKFGVTQREQLVRKGQYPHLLVMTATPIPRTLGLTLYGDLDISVIDEMPSGRKRIKTFHRGAEKLPKVWEFLKAKLAEGRQAYVVYPRVEESGPSGLKAVTTEFARLEKELAPHKVGLLHGRLKPAEKERVMEAFRQNRIHALLATPLVEVGLDVPNATVMLIEDAGQFGLAQLHQLRGRIGRGGHESYCILVGETKTEEARRRIQTMVKTLDGFQIAEADLLLRGPGELLGQQQSGLPPLKFGTLEGDMPLILRAKALAAKILDKGEARGSEEPAPSRKS